ncbi:MAG: AMP-binding protein, partial [Thiohalophilus sp.]
MTQTVDLIDRKTANDLHGLFLERVRRTPDNIAYRQFNKFKKEWQDITWQKMFDEVARWQAALKQENLQPGDRVGIILRNSPEWVKFEQAALSLGLVVVPLYTNDRPDNIAYIIQDADIRCLLLEDRMHWEMLAGVLNELDNVQRFICLNEVPGDNDKRLKSIREWLPENAVTLEQIDISPDDLASIVYTSGTTGRPKGVMLSHDNILWNACVCTECESFYVEDVYLSFLPLSHMLERTAGYYLPMVTGATTAYARSIDQLAEDLLTIKPTILISVPRIYERVNNKIKTQLES